MSKSDFLAAFCNLGIFPGDWKYLIMKARDPETGKWVFFVDKCLPFGAAISCAIFQAVSDAIAHIVKSLTKKVPVNYLEDYLFIALLKSVCEMQLSTFI